MSTSKRKNESLPKIGELRFDPNDKFEQQAWDGARWISASEFRKKFQENISPSDNINVASKTTPITDKQYQRDYNFGDVSLTGQSSNGVNITKDGNIFQFTGLDPLYQQDLNNNQYKGPLRPDDPNNNSSFIGMYVTGKSDIKLGNSTQQTLNINNTNPPKKEIITAEKKSVPLTPIKAIIIGDSLVPLIRANTKKLQKEGPEGILWKGGIAMNTLTKFIKAYAGDDAVTHVFISIGSNDRYEEFKSAPIAPFVKLLKEKFPKAADSIYLIKGDFGYDGVVEGGETYFGGKIVNLPKRRTDYFAKWSAAGVKIVNQEVGYAERHPTISYPSTMKPLGIEIDNIIGTSSSALPSTEVPQPKSTSIQQGKEIPDRIDEDTEDLMEEEYNDLPETEGAQLFEIITVTDISVSNINFNDPLIYGTYFKTKVGNDNIKYKNNDVSSPSGNYTMDGKKISADQCEVYYGDKTPYIAQLNNWGCLVTSISMMAPACGVNITQGMFYGGDLVGKDPYILPGNNLNLSRLQKDFPQLKRSTDYSAKLTRASIFEKYKADIRSFKRPIIIRMRGCSKPGRGHYVVAVGITKDGNIIIHNPARKTIAFTDQVIGSSVLLGSDQPSDNGKNYDILYIQ